MVSVFKVRATWSGFTGAPGYSNFHYSDLTTDTLRNSAGANVRAFFSALASYFMSTWTIQVGGEVTEYDMTTGDLIGSYTMSTIPTALPGTAAPGAFANGAGFSVQWNTNLIHTGRRLRGRTYIVPAMGCFDTDGTLSSGVSAAVQAAANVLITPSSPEFVVWKRIWTKPTQDMTLAEAKAFKQEQIGGATAPVTSHTLRDMASQLRTRKM